MRKVKCPVCGNEYHYSQTERHKNSAHHIHCEYIIKAYLEEEKYWLIEQSKIIERDKKRLQDDIKFIQSI